MRRPCERTWRRILEWAWFNGMEEFTHRDLLRQGVVSYSGSKRAQVWSASSSLHRMWRTGLLTRLAGGKGRRASLYAPISREEYAHKRVINAMHHDGSSQPAEQIAYAQQHAACHRGYRQCQVGAGIR